MVSGAIGASRTQQIIARYIHPGILQHRASMGVISSFKRLLVGDAATRRPRSQLGARQIVSGGELATLLGEPDTAIAILNRCRVPRRDVIRLKPVYRI